MKSVNYGATEGGYCVQIIEGGEVVDEYNAGNAPHCSQTYLHPEDFEAIGRERLLAFAKQTAMEMAREHGLDEDTVYHDTDIEDELKVSFKPESGEYDEIAFPLPEM